MSIDHRTTESIRFCIPIGRKPLGGAYSFLENWRSWLRENNFHYTEDLTGDYNVMFVNSFMVPYGVIVAAKRARPDLLVVQRVDGSARDYGRFDDADDRQARANMLADLTVFQSRYSKFSSRQKFRVIRRDGPVIYNPVDTCVFQPHSSEGSPNRRQKICIASHSANPKKGTWLLGALAKSNPDLKFYLCGNFPLLPNLPNIRLFGRLHRNELARAMRSCQVYLHLAENDPCPNVVLEALASGLPVLYRDSGGTPELVGKCGLPVTPENFRRQFERVMENHGDLSARARDRALGQFAPNRVFPAYIRAIVQAERRPLPSLRDLLQATLKGYPVLPCQPRFLYWQAKRWWRGMFPVREA